MLRNPPTKPLLIYDGNCTFCQKWILRLLRLTGSRIECRPSQECGENFSEIPPEAFEESIQFIGRNGALYSGALAFFQAMATHPLSRLPLFIYQNLPGFGVLSEDCYQWVARNRTRLSSLDSALTGLCGKIPHYETSTHLFLRLLAAVYFIAFASLGAQIIGLIGSNGITPARELLPAVIAQYDILSFLKLPTLFWLCNDDWILQGTCVAGAVLSIIALLGIAQPACFFLLWFLYLSLCSVGNVFLGFQWDNLLLEVGFLGILIAPWCRCHFKQGGFEAPVLGRWLLLWLLFRLMFSSGMVKWLSGDETWHHFTALQYHYETQPLPTFIGYFAHQLPAAFQHFSVLAMFGIELFLPFLIFGPRRLQLCAASGFIFLQLLITLTGNYCFFNLLSVGLCLFLIDDETWLRLGNTLRLPALFKPQSQISKPAGSLEIKQRACPSFIFLPLAALIFFLSLIQFSGLIFSSLFWPAPVAWLAESAAGFRTVNSYGLFAVMTTVRREITVEGSADGNTWFEYEFKWKPGATTKRPDFVAPYQPRLDWQMWFAALGSYKQNPWFLHFCEQLLRGSPDVLRLLKTNPFHEHPPKYIRAVMYEYHFTKPGVLFRNGEWWSATYLGPYCPTLYLNRQEP